MFEIFTCAVCVCIIYTKFIEATVTKLLSAEAHILQVDTFEAIRTLVAFSIRGTVGVWDGQTVPCHITDQKRKETAFDY